MLPLLVLLCLTGLTAEAQSPVAPGKYQRHPARHQVFPLGSSPPPPPPPPGVQQATSIASPTYTQVFNVTMNLTWFTGVSLLNDSTFLLSGGNWYQGAPYPFFIYAFDPSSDTPTTPVHAYPSVPGSVWPAGGVQPAGLFSGMSFTSDGAVYGAYGGASQEGPLWIESVPGVSGNWWETAAPIQASKNGSIVAYALTSMDHYDPLGPKHSEVVVLDTSAWPAKVLLRDALANGTGVEDVHLSADGGTLVLISAWDPSGAINTSIVRVYDVPSGSVLASFSTGWVDAACLSANGASLVLATCDSENAIEVYSIGNGVVTLAVNSTYPPGFPPTSTFTYADTCAITASGALFMVFPLWWGGSINQTAVAFWRTLPTSPTYLPSLPPTSLWLSPGISPDLQDSIAGSFTAGPYFAYTSWGGKGVQGGGHGPPPPTLHIFSEASPSAPVLEIGTPASEDPTVSGSLQSLDLAWDGTTLLVLCEGLDNHANIGSNGGITYLFSVTP